MKRDFPKHGRDYLNTPRIKVIGIGSGGSSAVNRMIAAGLGGVEFMVANTDVQALKQSKAPVKIQIGAKLTKGLGGADPDIGRQAALEDTDKILEALEGADVVFVITGLGGGTGTGAAPIVASLAVELNALTVAVVTKPFSFEGTNRRMHAERGLQQLKECVDTVITIPNDRLVATMERGASLFDAFCIADDILRQAVQGILDLIIAPGLINLDFADVKSVMSGMGMALMGTGTASGDNRAVEAAKRAISSHLLEDRSIQGARAVLINITGGHDLGLHEISEASSIIHDAADPDANIIFGAVLDERMKDEVRVTLIAFGFQLGPEARSPKKTEVSEPGKVPIPDELFVLWNPEVVAADDYAELVAALGDLVRERGGIGVVRDKRSHSYNFVREGAPA